MRVPINTSALVLKCLAVFLIFYGAVWTGVIYQRAKLVESMIQAKKTYAHLAQSTQKQIKVVEQTIAQTNRFSLVESRRRSKIYIVFFWCLTASELLTALFYISTGIALLKSLPWAQNLILTAIAMDMFFKSAVMGYHYFVLDTFKKILPAYDIYQIYFIPDQGVVSSLSGYFSGAAFLSRGAAGYILAFTFYIFLILYGLTYPVIHRAFKKVLYR